MMAFLSVKPGTLLSPVPVALIGSGTESPDGTPIRNLMTAAWVGTVCSEPPMVSVSVRPSRYTFELIEKSGEFTVNLTDRSMLRGTDYCGVRSGREEDKFVRCGWTPVPVEGLRFAPAVAESPLCLGCVVRERLALGSHTMYIGEIVYTGVRPELMDAQGGIRLQEVPLLTYSHGIYSVTGKPMGFFGCSVAAPKVYRRRMESLRNSVPREKKSR